MTRQLSSRRWLVAAAVVATLVGAGCGSDSDSGDAGTADTSATTAATAPTTAAAAPTTAAATTVAPATSDGSTVAGTDAPEVGGDSVPENIVSLAPTLTEMLYAVGAGDQVVAVDEYSDYPIEVLEKPHGLSGYEPNVEAIAAYEPDLVVISDDINGLSDQLESLGIAVWVGAAADDFTEVYSQIEQLGQLTGHASEAAEVIDDMKTRISAAVDAAPDFEVAPSYYHELDPEAFYSVTSDTFIGSVYGLFGLENIADRGDTSNPYPQLSAEFIVQQSPDLIFLADTRCCQQTPATVAARPGWDTIAAVQDGGAGVIPMDDDIASRWGPRVADYVEAVGSALNAVASVNA